MTGTPLDLTPFGVILQGIGILYWVLAIVGLVFALKSPPTRRSKAVAVAFVVMVFGALPASRFAENSALKAKQSTARAHFEMRCRSAGIKVARTVEDVDGILLMKLRPERVDYYDQFTPDDVYGHDNGGEYYIKSFLRLTRGKELLERASIEKRQRYGTGYQWVEVKDLKDGKTYRYTLAYKAVRKRSQADWEMAKKNEPGIGEDVLDFALERELIERSDAKYGLTWEEISTREDREQWVAGGLLKVVELQSNEVLAERRGYMWEYDMGSRSGGRTPWAFARDRSCPEFRMTTDRRAYFDPVSAQFAQAVLLPREAGK